MVNHTFVSLIIEPHLIHGLLDDWVVVFSFPLAVLVRKLLETKLSMISLNRQIDYDNTSYTKHLSSFKDSAIFRFSVIACLLRPLSKP